MITYWLIATLHYGAHTKTIEIPFNDNKQCVEAVKEVAKTTAMIEDLRCVAKRK